MTLAVLRALHAIIGDALDDIDRAFENANNTSSTPAATTASSVNSASSESCPPSPSTSRTSASESDDKSTHNRDGSRICADHAIPLSPLFPSETVIESKSLLLPQVTPPSPLDFPSLDAPYDSSSPSERLLSSDPEVCAAINRIVAACGQLSASVREPFLSLCDASLGVSLGLLLFLSLLVR